MSFKIRVGGPKIDYHDIQNVVKALKEERLSGGVYAEAFEKQFSRFIGVKHAIATNSASSALLLMLAAKGVKDGDEVITTPYTYAATTNVIMVQGAKPVFVDIESNFYNMDPSKIEEKITKKTKVIMPIHFGGQPSEMNEIMKIAKNHGLLVFEDAAPAAGALYYRKKVGGIGDAGAFSFFPDKNMTTGEGGMLTTNSDEIAKKAQIMKRNGAPSRYYHTEIGWNFKMPDPNAALGISQLKKLPSRIKEREKLSLNYSILFREEIGEEVITPKIKKGCTHTFNSYNIRFKTQKVRDAVKQYLEKKKIETRVCFPPVHLQPIYKKLLKTPRGSLPITEKCAKTTLCMPIFPGLTKEIQKEIVSHVKSAMINL